MLIETSSVRRQRAGSREGSGVATVMLGGELDLATAPEVEAALAALIAGYPGALLIDLRGLTYMDSTGINCLLRARAAAGACGVRIALQRGAGPAYRILALTGVDEAFEGVDGPDPLLDATAAP